MLTREPTAQLGFGALTLIAAVMFPSVAWADPIEECTDAYQKTQDFRDAGKLQEAIDQAQVCARDACPKQLRQDCLEWKTALEARISTIVIEVVDASGKPITEATVALDGKPWLARLDGSAQSISKGDHTLEITVQGSPPQTQAITITEGEKNRKIPITLGGQSATAEDPPSQIHSIGPWVVGGVGVAALIAGAAVGGVVVNAYDVMKENCNDQLETCSPDGIEAQDQGRLLGPVTTSLLVGGGVLVVGGVVWLLLAPKAPEPATTSIYVYPIVSPRDSGLVFGGSW